MNMKIKKGQILRTLRLKRQLTQNEAAKNFGISQQTHQKYESGKTYPIRTAAHWENNGYFFVNTLRYDRIGNSKNP